MGKGFKEEETVVEANGMVEVVVDDVIKKGSVDESFLEVLRSGSMQEYHEIGTGDYARLPGAVVILREVEGERVMPIFVGLVDGLSIWRSVSGWEPPRPFAHDLMRELLTTMNLEVESVAVVRLVDRTFYGEISLRERDGGSGLRRVDSRPSDAIALAARPRSTSPRRCSTRRPSSLSKRCSKSSERDEALSASRSVSSTSSFR